MTNSKEKKEWIISSHKGGRDKDIRLRINSKIKEDFRKLAKERSIPGQKKVSMADLLEEWILKEINKKKK